MEMIIDEKLREVAASDDEKYIQIYTKLCSSWAGSFIEVLARFVSREEADKLKQNGYYAEEKDGLEVLLPPKGVAPGEKVQLSLSKFFWLKKIMLQGIRAYQYW